MIDLAVSSDGKHLVSVGQDRLLKLWDRQGKMLKSIELGAEGKRCWVTPGDGGVACIVVGEVRLYDWEGKLKSRTATGQAQPALSPDLSVVALYEGGLTVTRADKPADSVKRVGTENTTIRALAASPDNQKVVLVGSSYNPASPALPDESVAYEYDLVRKKLGAREDTNQFGSTLVAFAPDGRRAIGGNSHPDSQTTGWLHLLPKAKGIPENWDGLIGDLSFSPDSSMLAVCEKETSLWNVRSGARICSLGMGFPVAALGNDFLVTGDEQGKMQIWEWTP